MNHFLFILIFFSSRAMSSGSPCHPTLCEDLDSLSLTCSETLDEKDCDKFVTTFDSILTTPACLASCATRNGAAKSYLHYDRLARLPFKNALKLFTSAKLRSSMDGHVAERYLKKSKADEKRLGKTLIPTNLRPECRVFEPVEFKSVKKDIVEKGKVTAPRYEYSEATIGDYIMWDGDVPKKIINTRTHKECKLPNRFTTAITKVPGQDIVRVESHLENGMNWDSLIELHQCKKIWEVSWGEMEEHQGEVSHHIEVDQVRLSSWKKCAPCWNKEFEACLRRI